VYSLLIQVPAGRSATTDTRWGLALAAGAQIDIDFGSRAEAGRVTTRAAPSDDDPGKALSGILGLVMLALAGAGLYWIVRTRVRAS